MNLSFPATTADLISANPRCLPDSVRAKLKSYARLGVIQESNGKWDVVRPKPDEPMDKMVIRKKKCPTCDNQIAANRSKCSECWGNIPGPKKTCIACGKFKSVQLFRKRKSSNNRDNRCYHCYRYGVKGRAA